MPCYDPPDGVGPFELGEAKNRELKLREALKQKNEYIAKYVDTLKGIEDFCNELVRVYADDPKRKPERVTAQSILAIINMHWGKP